MNRTSRFHLVGLFVCLIGARAFSGTIRVPQMAANIQSAVTAAVSGDTILLSAGTYTGSSNRNISFFGKRLVVIGAGKDNTTIDIQSPSLPAFDLNENEATGVVFAGITIKHGRVGIDLTDAYPELRDMRFLDNEIGIGFVRSDPNDTLTHLSIQGTEFTGNDTGLYILSGSTQPGQIASLSHCTFSGNNRGIVYYANDPTPDRHVNISNCLFRDNYIAVASYDFVFYQECVMDSCVFDTNATAILNSVTLKNSTIRGGQYGIKGFLSSRILVTNTLFEKITSTVLRTNVWSQSSQSAPPPNFNPGFYLTDCRITDNPGTIASLGGYINEDPVGATFTNCQFTNNGGGIFGVEGLHQVILDNCLYADNRDGIEMRASGIGLTITGCTFANNTGTAVDSWVDDWSVTIERSIFYGHSGAAIRLSHINFNSHWSVSCCDFFDNDGGECVGVPSQIGQNGNFVADPLFCDGSASVYTVYQQSPCLVPNGSCNQQIGALSAACMFSGVDSLVVDTATDNLHVVAPHPLIFWSRSDSIPGSQTAAEVVVGSDTDWSSAELWQSPTFITSDSFVPYNGQALVDGQTYYLRVRLAHNNVWSDWKEGLFRMNSTPTVPVPISPSAVSVTTFTPTLEVLNATDAESDELQYQFEIYSDSLLTLLFATNNSFAVSADTTAWIMNPPLSENGQYWWRARSFDGHESSAWTLVQTFWVNSTSEVPSAPAPIFPPALDGLPVYDMIPSFTWQPVVDPDPYDTIRYTLELSTDSLAQPHYAIADSLAFNTRYWWRVSAFDQEGLRSTPVSGTSFWTWTLGDVNHTNSLNIVDVLALADFLFGNAPPFTPAKIGDINGNCKVNLLDLTNVVAYLFRGGNAPKIGCQ